MFRQRLLQRFRGVRIALENTTHRPDHLLTVFVDQEVEATERMRQRIPDIPPSDPSFAVFKDGELYGLIPAHHIERSDANTVADKLKALFDDASE